MVKLSLHMFSSLNAMICGCYTKNQFQPDFPRQQPHNLHETYQLPRVQPITPDDGHRRCPKHVEFRDKIKLWILDASCWLLIWRGTTCHTAHKQYSNAISYLSRHDKHTGVPPHQEQSRNEDSIQVFKNVMLFQWLSQCSFKTSGTTHKTTHDHIPTRRQ